MAQRAGVSFELEALDLEGDRLVVTGHWSGVRGLRFVRPMLVADDRRILATLEHKPWAPSLDRAWVAAFPWDGAKVDVDTLTLAVAPQVMVALSGAPLDEPRPAPTPPPAPAPAPVAPIRAPEPVRDEPEPEPELPPAAAAPARPKRTQRTRKVAALEAELETVTRERDDAQRAREHALVQREDALAQRDEAVVQRDEALAQRDEALVQREEALAQRDEALVQREHARAQRDDALAQHDDALAQRDDVLLAYRELRREVEAERDEAADRASAAPAPDGEAGPAVAPAGRTMSTARAVMAQMQRTAAPASRLPFSMLDLWVMRVLGTIAAGCCILLLISLLRVFI